MNKNTTGEELYHETRRIIREAMGENQLVLFVGAGASVDAGIPLWGQAIEKIAKTLPLEEKQVDFLKIPQYYYNYRGKKEYTQLMRSIFKYGENLEPTMLHKKIIEFRTSAIITTNYDNLIEKAAEESSEFIQVISQDIDLPYRKAGRELIKMHGDFEHDNFVLKEDDYLHYSTNFKLIETYIKSLIGSKVVLFVGYSLNDPDVKQIIAWVKEILQQDFQRAYLILANKEANEIEKEYFKNLGVNIIYSSQLVENWEEKSISQQTVQTLDFFLEDEKTQYLERLYNNLKPLRELNFVYRKDIQRAFRKVDVMCDNDSIILSTDHSEEKELKIALWKFFSENKYPKDMNQNELDTIREILTKSSICVIERWDDNKYNRVELSVVGDDLIETMVYNFDYKGLHELREHNSSRLSSEHPELYMQQAYICAYLHDYYGAYNCLKNAASIFYRRKSYVWYFIAEFNRKYLGPLLTHPIGSYELSEEDYEQLKREVDAIDLDRVMNSIPDLGNEKNLFLRNLKTFNIAHNLFYDVYADSIKASEQAKTEYTFFGGVAAYQQLRRNVLDYDRYEIRNYIILDRYTENRSIFELYIRTILSSVMAESLVTNNNNGDVSGENVRQEKLTRFDLYIMLRNMGQTQMKKVFTEYDIKILPLEDDALAYMNEIADSICLYGKYIRKTFFESDVFWGFLEIINHIDISEELVLKLFRHLCQDCVVVDIRSYHDTINRFVINICNHNLYGNKICIQANKLVDRIFEFIGKDNSLANVFSVLILNLVCLSHNGGRAYNSVGKLKYVLNEENFLWIPSMYRNLGTRARNAIKKAFTRWEIQDTAKDYYQYCDGVLAGIFAPDREIENRMYDFIQNCRETEQKEPLEGIHFPKPVDCDDLQKSLVNLYLSNKIIHKERLKKIVENSGDEVSKWLLDLTGYDYSKFDCNWLKKCREGLLKRIASNKTARKNILRVYQSQFETKMLTAKVTDIIVKYFVIAEK